LLFFFQAEDGIRDRNVTGVQTCALPISIQALNILGAQTPTSTSSAPAAETSPAEGDTVHQVVIVGSGPAGYTAAIYAARAEMNQIGRASCREREGSSEGAG